MRTSLCLLIYIPSNVQESREKDNVGTVAYLKGYRSSKFRSINQGEKRRHRGTASGVEGDPGLPTLPASAERY